MKRWLSVILGVLLYILIHESCHMLVSAAFGEFDHVTWTVFSPQVIYTTSVAERAGIHWALIAGIPTLVTLTLGYLLLGYSRKAGQSPSTFWQSFIYYTVLIFLIADTVNLSLGPFIFGGDAIGGAVGLGISQYIIQAIFFIFLLVNRELIATKLLPAFGVETNHPLLRPWIQR